MKPGAGVDRETAYRVGAASFLNRELENEKAYPLWSRCSMGRHILVADKPHFLPVVPSENSP